VNAHWLVTDELPRDIWEPIYGTLEQCYFHSEEKFLFQFLIPSQATISTSIHILIPIHFVRPVATQVTQHRNT